MLSLALLLLSSTVATAWNPEEPRSLFVTSSYQDDAPECLRSSYHGVYGGDPSSQDHVFLPSTSCLMDNLADVRGMTTINMISGIEVMPDNGRFVWVGQAGVDHALSGHEEMDEDDMIQFIIEQEAALFGLGLGGGPGESQITIGGDDGSMRGVAILYVSKTSLVLWVKDNVMPVLDTLLPAHLVPVALPLIPYPIPSQDWEPVPRQYLDHLANVTKHLKFDAQLDEILENELDVDSIRRNVRYLTGEGPSGLETRHSFTKGARKAAEWIKEKAESTGATCYFHSYLPGFSPNVICEYPHPKTSADAGKVILSAHYDSRGSFGSVRAPGADDDGSGSAHLLEVASAVASAGIKFKHPVIFAWFSGEEQGLYGSSYYAAKLKEENETVILQVQADMLGYRAPGEPIQLALPLSIHTPEASYLLGNLSALYAPELVVGITPGCCSDHQSFHAVGYPATAVFERNGPIADPMYHNSGDLSAREGYDFEQIRAIAKVTMASVLTVAGWTAEGK